MKVQPSPLTGGNNLQNLNDVDLRLYAVQANSSLRIAEQLQRPLQRNTRKIRREHPTVSSRTVL